MRRMLAVLLVLAVAGIAVAQRSVQDEPMRPTQPIPSDARVLTDKKEVRQQTARGVYTWLCFTHAYAWTDGGRQVVARACSTSYWYIDITGNTPASAYYIEVFGPYRVVRLEMAFTQVSKGYPVSAQFNEHLAGLYYDNEWTTGNRVLRAPSAHMGYHGDAPGDVAFYEFTHGVIAWPRGEVGEVQ